VFTAWLLVLVVIAVAAATPHRGERHLQRPGTQGALDL
jgi:hypothetical protein